VNVVGLRTPARRDLAVTAVAVAVSTVLAALSLVSPLAAIATVGAGALGFIGITRVDTALLIWVPIVFVGALPRLDVLVHGYPVALAISLAMQVEIWRTRRHPLAVRSAVLLVGWLVLSLAWAERSAAGYEHVVAWLGSAACLLVVMTVVAHRPRRASAVALAFVIGATLSALLGLTGLDADLLEDGAPVRAGGRIVGGLGDPNSLAAVAVAGTALAIGLLGAASVIRRVVLAASIIVLAAAFMGTESRGGIVGAAVAVAVALALDRRSRRARPGGRSAQNVALVLAGVVLLAVASAVELPDPGDRLLSDVDTGRGTLWSAASDAYLDHPLTGVGIGNFTEVSYRYAERTGPFRYDLLVLSPKTVHNTYLSLLVETGPVGLGLFLLLAGSALRAGLRAERAYRSRGEIDLERIARAVVVATAAFLTTSFFLSVGSAKPLWILYGLAVGLDQGARSERQDGGTPRGVAVPVAPAAVT
jgi:O-antigen ligase